METRSIPKAGTEAKPNQNLGQTACFELKEEGRKIINQFKKESPFLAKAKNGSFSREDTEKYLQNLFYIFQNTPISLRQAIEKATKLKQFELVRFLKKKLDDEQGHDIWAQNDLRNSGFASEKVNMSLIADDTLKVLQYGRDIIDREPALFLAYMFAFEFITIEIGQNLIDDLENNCGIPRSNMSGVNLHVKLDQDHVEDDLEIIGNVVTDFDQKDRMKEVLSTTLNFLGRTLNQCLAKPS